MIGDGTLFYDIANTIILPSLTAVGGWFASVWRSKQKKEADVLDNVKQILELQKEYITEQQEVIAENKNMIKRLEAKLDRKSKSIRQANRCKYTNEDDGCPVLVCEEKFDESAPECSTCKYKQQPEYAES